MEHTDMTSAFELIGLHMEHAYFLGPRDGTLIDKAEKRLGVRFPPSYRQFIARLGAGAFGFAEFYGIVKADFEHSSVPDAIWVTVNDRSRFGLPDFLVAVYDVGDGTTFYIDTSNVDNKGESPIVTFYRADSVIIATPYTSFGQLFLEKMQQSAEDLETAGEDEEDFEILGGGGHL